MLLFHKAKMIQKIILTVTDLPKDIIESYIKLEQPNTQFDLTKRINVDIDSDIEISFDANRLSNQSFTYIQKWAEIFDSNEIEIGEFELDIFNIKVNKIKYYEIHNKYCKTHNKYYEI